MAEMRKRTSMSVLEMGRMLGLGKTESYWLIKKNYFKTILVGNTMRVMIDSFEEWYAKLIEEKGLPKVVFHSLRHSSITYKLKLNGGDMKSVQGDSGHAQVKMVADVYSHIIDDDRRLNAERMEAAFYSGRQATPEPVQPAATESSADDKELLLKLLQNPEMAALLKSLAKTL